MRLSALLTCLLACASLPAAAEQFDTSFAGTGRIVTAYPGFDLIPVALLEQPGGNIAWVSMAPGGSAGCSDPFCVTITTLGADGVPHATSGAQALGFFWFSAAAVDSSGRVIVVGTTVAGVHEKDIGVARFNPDGSLDASFATGGVARIDYFGEDDNASAVAIDRDDNIVIAGRAQINASDSDFAVMRLLGTDGSPDPAFFGGGMTTIAFDLGPASGPRYDEASVVAIDHQGRIVVGGLAYDNTIGRDRIGLARLTPTGYPDTSLCESSCNFMGTYTAIHSGRRVYYFGASDAHEDQVYGIDVMGNGDFFIAGTSFAADNVGSKASVARLDAAGNYISEHLDAGIGAYSTYGGVRVSDANATRVLLAGDTRPLSGNGQNYVLMQAFTSLLAPLSNYGTCLADNSAICFDHASGLDDSGYDVVHSLLLDHLGRALFSAAVVPTEDDHRNTLLARFTNATGPRPDVIFRNGFN
jgi:uncharacterized delta-60 repeat protein